MMLLKNCSVLPELTEEYQGTSCDVLIEGEKIKGIYACGECPEEAEDVIDLKGKYLLPGFFDLHVHLTLSGGDTLTMPRRPYSRLLTLQNLPETACWQGLRLCVTWAVLTMWRLT